MKVAIIVSRIEQAGPVIVIRNLVNSLISFSELTIQVFYIDKKVDPLVKINLPFARLDFFKFRFEDFDIIHTNGIRPDLFAFIYRKRIKYHISTIHNFVFDDLFYTYNNFISWFFGNIWLLLWKRADKLVCVSAAMKYYYSNWFPESKMEVIYNGIDEIQSSFATDSNVLQSVVNFHSDGLKVIGSVGMLTRRKGIDQILYLLAAERSLALIIIGDGKELANLIHLSEKLKISDRCMFCGFRSNVSIYIKYFDFFIMPSRSEGFGLALIEAVQQKVPVICSAISVFKELFNDKEVTFFELGNLGSLTDAIKTVMITGHYKAGLAYTKYLNHYSSSIMAKNYYELYKSA
jgi:glycosyltransferase involved in cell wall biosynthesis